MADDPSSAKPSSSWSIEDTSGTVVSTAPGEEARDGWEEVVKIIEREARAVRVWHYVVTIMILVTAIFVTVLTFWLLQREEEQDFAHGVSGVKVAFSLSQYSPCRNALPSISNLNVLYTCTLKHSSRSWLQSWRIIFTSI